MSTIGVIGGGPAGMMAALQATTQGARVLLFDANNKLGRKLVSTGSGRCNISNLQAKADRYYTDDFETLNTILSELNTTSLLRILSSYAIPTSATPDGWIYPLSDSAANVASILTNQLQAREVTIYLHTLVTDIQVNNKGFQIKVADADNNFQADKIIIACGSPAYPQLGARHNLLTTLEKLGHTTQTFQPALTPILTDPRPLHKLQGVRMDMQVGLHSGKQAIAQTTGNVIITSWGLNGPGVMDLSHHISIEPHKEYWLHLNFLYANEELLRTALKKPENSKLAVLDILLSFLPQKVAVWLLQHCKISPNLSLAKLSDTHAEKIIQSLKDTRVAVKGVQGFKKAQAASGGVLLSEIHADSLESKKVSGLYLAGEILNVLGPCGGFNLHWAFVSGYLAGQNAAKTC